MKKVKLFFTNFWNFLKNIRADKGLFRFLSQRMFMVVMFFIFVEMMFGVFIVYKYTFSRENNKTEEEKILIFDKDAYQKVLDKTEDRQKRFEESVPKKYSNPFREKPNQIKLQ